jgi:Tol biopolymer transport system component
VTLEELSAYFDVSPDGKQVAYTTFGTKGRHALKIIPSNGGTARAIVDPVGRAPVWGPDGRHIYYVMDGGPSSTTVLMRVSVDSGQVETIFTWPRLMILLGSPNRNILFRAPLRGPRWELAGLDGHALGRLTLPEGMVPWSVSKEGDKILAVRKDRAAPITVLPVQGGPMRRLNESHSWDRPIGWSADGTTVLFETELNGRNALFFVPLAGGPMKQVKLPDPRTRRFTPILSGDGNHILYAIRYAGDELSTLKVFSIDEDWSWELSRRHTFGWMELTGAGGTFHRDGDDFLFLESQEGGYELRRSPPRGPSRLLRTFSGNLPDSIAVHDSRIAYVQSSEGVSSLFLASAGEGTARPVPRQVGMLSTAAWSPDGMRIAAYRYDPKRFYPEGRDLIVFDVTPSNEFKGPVRAFAVPPGHWWAPQWLPDGSGILVTGIDGNIWLILLDPSARPVNLTRDDPNIVWRFRLSPDGRYIAYPSERPQGSSIWLMNLKEPLVSHDN